MKLKMIVRALFAFACLSTHAVAFASMAGLCNDPNYTQYICCPEKGGWIVSPDCYSGASPYCANDTGLISGSNPPITILDECKKRGGNEVSYPF